MAGFSELIKDLEKLRDYDREFFLYGFRPKEEFTQRSPRTYEDEQRRAELLYSEFMRSGKTGAKKIVAMSVDCGDIFENPFYRAYYIKSFTDNDIKLHFSILDILRGEERLTVKELCDTLYIRFGECLWSDGRALSERTVRAKLDEYSDEGLILRETIGKKVYYSSSPDDIEDIFRQFDGLADAAAFFSEDRRLGVVGNTILKALGRKNDIFLMKHNYIVDALDDEILFGIAEAVNEGRVIEFTNFGAGGRESGSHTENRYTVIPFYVLVSSQSGRRYLMAYDLSAGDFSISRLDRMRRVEAAGSIPKELDTDKLYERARKTLSCMFGVSFGRGAERGGRVYHARLVLRADEKTEGYVIGRFFREKRCGSAERTGENEYTLSFDVFDPSEMLPWIRTFTGRILDFECGSERTERLLYDDVKRTYEMYFPQSEGGDGNADVAVQ